MQDVVTCICITVCIQVSLYKSICLCVHAHMHIYIFLNKHTQRCPYLLVCVSSTHSFLKKDPIDSLRCTKFVTELEKIKATIHNRIATQSFYRNEMTAFFTHITGPHWEESEKEMLSEEGILMATAWPLTKITAIKFIGITEKLQCQ